MRLFKLLYKVLLLVLLIIIGAILGFNNNQPLTLHFLDWQTPEASAYYWYIAFAALGFLICLSVTSTVLMAQALKIRKLQAQLKANSKELGSLRAKSLTQV